VLIGPGNLPGRTTVAHCSDCRTSWLSDYSRPHDYWEGGQESAYTGSEAAVALRREAEADLRLLELFAKPGRLVDIGSGLGDFIEAANERGWRAQGIDPSTRAVEAARSRGLRTSPGSAEQPGLPPESFDAVTMRDVLEHACDPLLALKSSAELLKCRGLLFVRTPNELSLYKGIARALWKASLGRLSAPLSFVYYTPHHFAFSARSFEQALPRLGFKMVRLIKKNTPTEFSRARLMQHHPRSRWASTVSKLIPIVQVAASIVGRENKLVVLAKKEKVNHER
jgi:2-polyprenyl-3-methyl-5-hydroxy-6-metoxy-1,4-benzoquinol methylase